MEEASRDFAVAPTRAGGFSLCASFSAGLGILVSIWGNGGAQGKRLVHSPGPDRRRAHPSPSAPAPALCCLHSRSCDPTFRAHSQARQVRRRPGLGQREANPEVAPHGWDMTSPAVGCGHLLRARR